VPRRRVPHPPRDEQRGGGRIPRALTRADAVGTGGAGGWGSCGGKPKGSGGGGAALSARAGRLVGGRAAGGVRWVVEDARMVQWRCHLPGRRCRVLGAPERRGHGSAGLHGGLVRVSGRW